MKNRIWRDVVGYEGLYQVSDRGEVRRLERIVPHLGGWRTITPRLLKPRPTPEGYARVKLRDRLHLVHRLVLEAFVGPCPEGMEACHGDRGPTDQRIQNLRWDTHCGNMKDRDQTGQKNPMSRTWINRRQS